MLTITKEQLAIFREPAIEVFVKKVLVHLNKCFPEKCKEMSEQVEKLVRYGIGRAAGYDIRAERDVVKYIDLMMVFGVDFDDDPKLPWASRILNDPNLPLPRRKIWELNNAAKHYSHE